MTSEEVYKCEYCGSDNVIKKRQAGYAVMLSILLLGIPLPFLKDVTTALSAEKNGKYKRYFYILTSIQYSFYLRTGIIMSFHINFLFYIPKA